MNERIIVNKLQKLVSTSRAASLHDALLLKNSAKPSQQIWFLCPLSRHWWDA